MTSLFAAEWREHYFDPSTIRFNTVLMTKMNLSIAKGNIGQILQSTRNYFELRPAKWSGFWPANHGSLARHFDISPDINLCRTSFARHFAQFPLAGHILCTLRLWLPNNYAKLIECQFWAKLNQRIFTQPDSSDPTISPRPARFQSRAQRTPY